MIGVAYFEKLAIDNHWLGETARVIQGGVLGLAAHLRRPALRARRLRRLRADDRRRRRAILYLSTYAAFNFYHLIDRPLAFALMVGDHGAWSRGSPIGSDSQGLALFAVGGGFATPFMLPGTPTRRSRCSGMTPS